MAFTKEAKKKMLKGAVKAKEGSAAEEKGESVAFEKKEDGKGGPGMKWGKVKGAMKVNC